jgi:hypothetical protein
MRLQEAFDKRRKFLEEVDRKGIPESDFVKQIEQTAIDIKMEMDALKEEERQLRQVKLEAGRQLQEQAQQDAARIFATTAQPVEMTEQQAQEQTMRDIERARAVM